MLAEICQIVLDGFGWNRLNSVLCMQCGKWINSRCAKVKRVSYYKDILHAENLKGILERQWSRKDVM